MILSNRINPGAGRVTTIRTKMFVCIVSTGKDSVADGQATVIFACDDDAIARRPVGKLTYMPASTANERDEAHEAAVGILDGHGMLGRNLSICLDLVLDDFKKRSAAAAAIRVPVKPAPESR